eukprot:TRINITY_DN31330_c0_g1_i1.p1 TRINITY_DN31330_c0_g1~~TRINITY_DN31330_c0_g1_i1.p1  ORF type:complete len:524 (-),score=17.32 TRINITY_DN31330_c0_g1_i1:260-1831(-)
MSHHITIRNRTGSTFTVCSKDIVPKRLGLVLKPPSITLEYEVPGRGLRVHHRMQVQYIADHVSVGQAIPSDGCDSWSVTEAQRLREIHEPWISGVSDRQITGILARLHRHVQDHAPISLSIATRTGSERSKRYLSDNEAEQLIGMVLGKRRKCGLPNEWLQGWGFEPDCVEWCPYGLRQVDGGPCGVVASVQAFLIGRLLKACVRPSVASRQECRHALLDALTDVLHMCATTSTCNGSASQRTNSMIRVVVPPPINSDNGKSVSPEKFLKGPHGCMVVEFSERDELRKAWEHDPLASAYFIDFENSDGDSMTSGGVPLFLYSVLATHGVDSVREVADVPTEVSMVAAHGYCSQEAVNLMLTGEATSNVFDGTKTLGGSESSDKVTLRGIATEKRPRIGFLSLFEAFGSLEVGSSLKDPDWPVWVIHAESHYSVLFSGEPEGTRDMSIKCLPPCVPSRDDCTDVWYYDPLGRQEEEKRISVHPGGLHSEPDEDDLETNGMIAKVIRTRWGRTARLDWNGSEPIY